MTQAEFDALLAKIQAAERQVRADGQKEYAHDPDNCLANFDNAVDIGVTREQALLVLAHKHWRGIVAWVNGHRSQREDVRGRIKDLRLYLALLWAMADETESAQVDVK